MKKMLVGLNLLDKDIISGHVCFSTIQGALDYATGKTEIFLLPGHYYEKLIIDKPNISIIGSPNASSIIYYDVCHGDIVKDIHGGDGTKIYGTTGSATVTILESATNFYSEKVVYRNSHNRIVGSNNQQAVALKTSADSGYFNECIFEGYQDTLYVDKGVNLFNKCSIKGDVDFIFGAGQALFNKCSIHLIKHDENFEGYICAPSTLESKDYGFIFYQCSCDYDGTATYYLGRPWHPSGCHDPMISKVLFSNCDFKNVKKFTKMKDNMPNDNMLYLYEARINNRRNSNISQIEANHYLNKVLEDIKERKLKF